MKLKIDENISGILPVVLKISTKFDVTSVQSQAKHGITDSDLLSLVKNEGRILITADTDFENMIMYPPGTHHGILILKSVDQGKKKIGSLVRDFFKELKSRGYNYDYLVKRRITARRIDDMKVLIQSVEPE